MILMRDGFVDGLFGGMERVNRIRSQWMDLDDRRAQADAAELAREQMDREDQRPRYTPMDQRVEVGPQQPRAAVRTQPVDLTPSAPASPPAQSERRGDIPGYVRAPSALAGLPPDQPPRGGVAPRVDDATQARRARDAWGRTPQDGYGPDGTPLDGTLPGRRAYDATAPLGAPGVVPGRDYRSTWDRMPDDARRIPSPAEYDRPLLADPPAAAPQEAPARGGVISGWGRLEQPGGMPNPTAYDRPLLADPTVVPQEQPPGIRPLQGPARQAPGPADGYDHGGAPPSQTPGRRPWWDWTGRAQERHPPSYMREPAPTAPPPAQPEPGQQGADAAPTVGSRVLSVLSRLNPIGSAQAATPVRGPVGAPQAPPEPAAPAPSQVQPAQAPQAAVVSQAPPVAPQQAGPTAVSGPPPAYVRPPFNDQPYAFLARQAPQDRTLVDRIAQEEGVNPARLALHWWLESGLRHQAPDGAAGERGPLQMLPGTQRMVDPQGKLDPTKVEDALRLAARYIYRNDAIFGADTASSIVAYQGGPGTAMRFAQDPVAAARTNPNGAAYLARAYPGNPQWSREHFPPAIDVDGDALIRTAIERGPQEFVQLIARSSPGRGIDDGWRAAETAMVYAALRRGDYQGAQNARELVLHMSQAGATQSLQQAYQALAAGNGQGAAAALAKAHAFVPDGMAGQFGVDKAGNLWGRMVDDRDPNKPMGDFFRVTPQDIQRLMIQTRDPNKYAKMIQEQQDHASRIRLQTAQSRYYEGADDRAALLADARGAVAETRAQGALEAARIRADAQTEVAALRGQVDGRREQHTADVMKEIGVGEASIYAAEADPMRRAALETIHADLRVNNPRIAPGAAKAYAEGVLNGRIHLIPGQNGTYGLVDKESGVAVGVLSPQAAQRILPSLRQAAPGRATQPALPRATAE